MLFPERRVLDLAASRTGIRVDVLRIANEGLTLGRVVSGGHEIALEDPDNITLLLPLDGRIEMQFGDMERGIGGGSSILVQAEKRRTRVIAPKGGVFRATTLQIPRSRIATLMARDQSAAPRSGEPAIRAIDTAFGRQVVRMLSELADDIFRRPDRFLTARALEDVVSLIDDLLVTSIGSAGAGTRSFVGLREFQRVSRACDIMHAQPDDAPSIADLAVELGVSPRYLQLSFRAVHGISPRQYLERIRLDRVRSIILAQGQAGSVTSAALDSGFSHLGRFSQAYRRAFGELPSETVAQRRHMPAPPARPSK